jgi:hypothetical protein
MVDRDIYGQHCQEQFKLQEIYDLCKSGQQTLV